MKKIFITLLTLFIFTGCGTTYSPEQLTARAQDKSDFDLCFEMVLPNPSSYSKQELMNRETDCTQYLDEIVAKRQKQLVLGQALMNLSNTMKTNTTPNYSVPNYSNNSNNLNNNPNIAPTQYWSLTNNYIEGTTRVCVYSLLGKVKYETFQNQFQSCPLGKWYPMQ
tara:strand:- start:99 stop:596 length:498 start_codon:yes stop_codon:yes gene_type:complete